VTYLLIAQDENGSEVLIRGSLEEIREWVNKESLKQARK
jgi:predicted XRE-type DNA-binding protein